jgi:hypothetical protein
MDLDIFRNNHQSKNSQAAAHKKDSHFDNDIYRANDKIWIKVELFHDGLYYWLHNPLNGLCVSV